jgi:hypothetical protein
MAEVWAKWEGQVIDGVFPLRRILSSRRRHRTRRHPEILTRL